MPGNGWRMAQYYTSPQGVCLSGDLWYDGMSVTGAGHLSKSLSDNLYRFVDRTPFGPDGGLTVSGFSEGSTLELVRYANTQHTGAIFHVTDYGHPENSGYFLYATGSPIDPHKVHLFF